MLRTRFLVSLLAATLVLWLAPAPRADAATITSSGCGHAVDDPDQSCTLTQLLNKASFAINNNTFANFSLDTLSFGGNTDLIVVTPTCEDCGSFGGNVLAPGFVLDFGGTFKLTQKPSSLSFDLGYDFLPSQATFLSMNKAIATGDLNPGGESFVFDLSSSGYPGPNLDLNCSSSPNICTSNNTARTNVGFFSPTSTSFRVSDVLSMGITSADTGRAASMEVTQIRQSFVALPEPGSLAMFGAVLGACCITARLRKPKGKH